MLVQLHDHDLLDTGFDDVDTDVRPNADHDDQQDLRYVERNLETDFGLDRRVSCEARFVHAEARLRAIRANETPRQKRLRRIAHLRRLIDIIDERHRLTPARAPTIVPTATRRSSDRIGTGGLGRRCPRCAVVSNL